jgi:hypothetical protein
MSLRLGHVVDLFAGALGAIFILFWIILAILNYRETPTIERARSLVLEATEVAQLPLLATRGPERPQWDLMEGLKAREVADPRVVGGQPVLQLMATSGNVHRLGVMYKNMAIDTYHATVWVKPGAVTTVLVEGRDGRLMKYGNAVYDLAAQSVLEATGDTLARGIDIGHNGWLKLWLEVPTSNTFFFVMLTLKGAEESPETAITFGGVETEHVNASR